MLHRNRQPKKFYTPCEYWDKKIVNKPRAILGVGNEVLLGF